MSDRSSVFEGQGTDVNSALLDALEKAKNPHIADEAYKVTVVNFGAESKGFSGQNIVWVSVIKSK